MGSLFAGIGGFDLGFEQAGFQTLWAVEKEAFCRAVLAKHFPEAEIFTDVRDVGKHNLRPVDVVTAGFPCQDLSVAGKRAGLAGDRSGLFWEARRVIGELQPTWFVLENVPGLFSSNEGRDFGVVLNAMDELGYGLAWRVFDSQYFGVAQRRRRVFIVGHLGGPCPAEVLLEPEGVPGNPPARRKAGERVTPSLTQSVNTGGIGMSNQELFSQGGGGAYLGRGLEVSKSLRGRPNKSNREDSDTYIPEVVGTLSDGAHNGGGSTDKTCTREGSFLFRMQAFGEYESDGTASAMKMRDYKDATDLVVTGGSFDTATFNNTGQGWWNESDVASPVRTPEGSGSLEATVVTHSGGGTSSKSHAMVGMAVRRLTPTECARLQAFPDDWLDIEFKGKPASDGAKYKALGNAVTVSVIRWIAERIKTVSGAQPIAKVLDVVDPDEPVL